MTCFTLRTAVCPTWSIGLSCCGDQSVLGIFINKTSSSSPALVPSGTLFGRKKHSLVLREHFCLLQDIFRNLRFYNQRFLFFPNSIILSPVLLILYMIICYLLSVLHYNIRNIIEAQKAARKFFPLRLISVKLLYLLLCRFLDRHRIHHLNTKSTTSISTIPTGSAIHAVLQNRQQYKSAKILLQPQSHMEAVWKHVSHDRTELRPETMIVVSEIGEQ